MVEKNTVITFFIGQALFVPLPPRTPPPRRRGPRWVFYLQQQDYRPLTSLTSSNSFNSNYLITHHFMKHFFLSSLFIVLLLSSCRQGKTEAPQPTQPTETTEQAQPTGITAEMAYEGVNNYCHQEYDWSVAKDNPSIMSVTMGEETDSAYQVVFRSYTGALVYFYVDKASGTTKMVEHVPALNIENEAGTIEISDYLKKG